MDAYYIQQKFGIENEFRGLTLNNYELALKKLSELKSVLKNNRQMEENRKKALVLLESLIEKEIYAN